MKDILKHAKAQPKHYHCPHDCENPQPFEWSGDMYCARCWVHGGLMVKCILCTPATCKE